jgi:hypothetical protein
MAQRKCYTLKQDTHYEGHKIQNDGMGKPAARMVQMRNV